MDDVLRIFLITENYLFRRNICDVPTNALNKVFLTLNREILRFDNTADNYVAKLIYVLLSKRESSRFPDDAEFCTALANKQVYQMRGKYKAYLFERFENYGTIETKDVYTHLDNNVYTIEHIMPQHLTPAWTEALGADYAEIHETWLHRLANLTLTGYNPGLSNKSFAEKRDAEESGYKASGLKMNQKIASKTSWGLAELQERNDEMVALAKKIWSYPETDFKPSEKEYDSCTLDDENIDLTGRDISKYSLQNIEQIVSSWTDMFEHVIKYLHQKDKSVLAGLAYKTGVNSEIASYVSKSENGLRSALKIDENIYIEKNTSTAIKISILRRLFAPYGVDPMDLVFFLKDTESEKAAEAGRFEIRKRYWAYALPVIQKQNLHRGTFGNSKPSTSNLVYGSFGISGFHVICAANFDCARVDFFMENSNASQNKAAYDILFSHKEEIEEALGIIPVWNRYDEGKASWLSYSLNGVSINNESDWQRMATFHAEWSDRFCEVILPYLRSDNRADKRLADLARTLRDWAINREDVNVNLAKCTQMYTRFTTDNMSGILPDIYGVPSGWKTDNHYFYEIVNVTGNSFYIKFVISSHNANEGFLATCEKINQLYPAKSRKGNWQWRTHFKTTTIFIDDDASQDEIFARLDDCFKEVLAFEAELKRRMEM